MSQLQIVEASAGSGKTHRLVFEYLRLLLLNPDNYQHILAVTFTNKATEEMKSRIILELSKLRHICNSSCNPSCERASAHLSSLSENLKLSAEDIAQKAGIALYNILHNYSRFSIMTIDSFFQQILRAFLREVGLGTSTRIELDEEWVIQQTVDQLLLDLDAGDELYQWLVHYMLEQIAQGKSWSVSEKLMDMAHELLSEKFFALPADYQQRLFSEGFRQQFPLNEFYQFKSAYKKYLREKAQQALEIISKNSLNEADFSGKSKGVVNFFNKLKASNFDNLRRDDTYDVPEKWPHKDSKNKEKVLKILHQEGLFACYQDIINYLNENQQKYNDVLAILKNIYTYGVLADIAHALDKVLRENDIQLLSRASQFIQLLIGQNDAPFIYEKSGRFLRHFIIDEFQDTSYLQWQNFRPLISESLANDNFAMVVGDVKQSIYRWRNTDWTILERKAEEDVRSLGSKRITLDTNWRSLPEIVNFNNAFFGDYLVTANPQLVSIYKTVKQTCAYRGEFSGMVKIEGNLENNEENNEGEDNNSSAANWAIDQILKLLSLGYRQKDIAILVRERKEGIIITEAINNYNQKQSDSKSTIHVLSAETALLTQCVAINIITEVFQYLLNPNDAVNLAALQIHLEQVNRLLVSAQVDIDFDISIDNFLERISSLLLDNPVELFEEVVQMLSLNQYTPFLPYLQAFHNYIHDFCITHIPHLKAFMEYWEHKKDKVALELSEKQDAVRILTIHKAKGLQFPNVIIPFCNWSLNYRGNQAPLLWCEAKNSPAASLQYIPIRYAQELENTSFREEYEKERTQYFIDNINLLYVALTRPMHHLFVYIPQVKDKSKDCQTVGDWLYRYVLAFSQSQGAKLFFQKGELQYVSEISGDIESEDYQFTHYAVYPTVQRVKQKSAYGGILTPIMQYGNIMHRLFQYIHYADDIEMAVDVLVTEGMISARERQTIVSWLEQLLAQPEVQAWYNRHWKIYTEATVVAPFQHPYRPDRVMIKDNHAVVVDYKFGTRELIAYKKQLKTYMTFLSAMGYLPVEGYLWYVQLGKIEKVE